MAKGVNTKPAPTKAPLPRASVPDTKRQSTELDEMDDMESEAGRGVSTSAEDNVVPLIYVLQPLSPQAIKKNPKYVQGAEAGMFWFRGTPDLVEGDEKSDGMLVQSCHFSKYWAEWRPDRGGFVARHAERPADAEFKEVKNDKGDKVSVWVRPNGNRVVETREHALLVYEDEDATEGRAGVINFSSTGHATSRAWMGLMNRVKLKKSGKTAPCYGALYRLRTVFKENDKGQWFAVVAELVLDDDGKPRFASKTQRRAGREVADAFEQGTKRADNPDDEAETEHEEL